MAQKTSKFGRFVLKVSTQTVILEAEGESIKFSPAEAKKVTALLGMVGSMEALKVVPTPIKHSPFAVDIKEDKLRLVRADTHTRKGPVFAWNEIDELVKAIHSGVQIAVDRRRLRRNPRATTTPPYTQGQVIEE